MRSGEGEGWRQREGNKPRPNLLPSDFSALGEGYAVHTTTCDKELLSQGDSSKTGDKDDIMLIKCGVFGSFRVGEGA